MHSSLQANVCDFIKDGQWSVPADLALNGPAPVNELHHVPIPNCPAKDQIVWSKSDSGCLSFKDAYSHSNPAGNLIAWSKLIWKNCIPPSKSFIMWMILQNRMPTDENPWARGRMVVSVCSLCGNAAETTEHLFLSCLFAQQVWTWFSSVVGCSIDCSSFFNVLSICSRNWCTQVHDVTVAAVVNIVSAVWFCRNKARFDNVKMNAKSTIKLIISNASLVGNTSKGKMSSSVAEFMILKAFNISGHPDAAPSIIQVQRIPLSCYMVK